MNRYEVRHWVGSALAVAGIAFGFAAAPAHAEFYQLDGRFQCLERPHAVCGDESELPSGDKPHAITAAPLPSPRTEPRRQEPPVVAPALSVDMAPRDPLLDIAARIGARQVSAHDLAQLHALANKGDGHAIELLAWCDYRGIGMPRDPVAAYLLYDVAAAAGIAHARENRAVIYEYALTPDQQQLVLDIRNDDKNPTMLR